MNQVELQNVCLALGHLNVFITSTLSDSTMGSAEKVEYNSKGRILKHTGLLRMRCWCEEALMAIVEQGEASTLNNKLHCQVRHY